MRFTSMFRYGLRALTVLSDHYGERPVSAKEISEMEDISPSFLEQLLAHLRRHGIISGTRGPGGGFMLTRQPEEILIKEVVEALEGPFYVSSCLKGDCNETSESACERFEFCSVVGILGDLERDINGVLSSYRLSDIKREERS